MHYQIAVKGHLDDKWSDWFEGLRVCAQPQGLTLLSGELPDQAALFGVLGRIHALNLSLRSVQSIQLEEGQSSESERAGDAPSSDPTVYKTHVLLHAVAVQNELERAGIPTKVVGHDPADKGGGLTAEIFRVQVSEADSCEAMRLLEAKPRTGEVFCVPRNTDFSRA